jgi:DNA-binding response OmpR family regulator
MKRLNLFIREYSSIYFGDGRKIEEKSMQDVPSILQEADSASVKMVLIVEDDATIGEALLAFLQEATDYQVTHVSDRFAALKMVRTLIPHLVVLDYQLPGMDGLECLDHLRASKGMEQTPAILMSAALPQNVQVRTDLIFLEKPFEMETFLTLVREFLEH